MEFKETVRVKAHQSTITYYICDTCGRKVTDRAWGEMKQCHICKKDVCKSCAIITDHWYLEHGSFAGDYPDYFCKKCWELSNEVRKEIQVARDREIELWEQWHKLAVEPSIEEKK